MRSASLNLIRFARASVTQFAGPLRQQRLARRGESPIPVFFYHRVADEHPNPWTISTARFKRQVERIRNHCQIIGLDEVQRRLKNGQSKYRTAAITFDDGYQDNCQFALPYLVKKSIPATYFVSVDNVRQAIPFPHDVAAGTPLAPNTVDELKEWSDRGIEIGLHTRSHFDFSTADDDQTIEREITSAATELSDLLGRPIRYFAFPYGMPEQLRQRVVKALAKLGLSGFCSAYGAYNLAGQDTFHIRRIHGDECMSQFNNWLYFDPGKLQKEPKLPYRVDALEANDTAASEKQTCLTR